MNAIHPKIFVDEKGTPKEVLISWKEYQDLVETLGFDLDKESQKDLIEGKWAGVYRIRQGSLRIIYLYPQDKDVVLVTHIAPRGDIYKSR